MKSERAILPVDAGKSQPARISRKTRKSLNKQRHLVIQKAAGIVLAKTGDVLLKELVKMSKYRVAIREVLHLEGIVTAEEPFALEEALFLFVDGREREIPAGGQIQHRSHHLVFLVTGETYLLGCCGQRLTGRGMVRHKIESKALEVLNSIARGYQ